MPRAPRGDAFLSRIMGGDEEVIGYIRRAAGYALTGDVGEQCLFLLYGNGRNGKSVLLNALLHVLGDYGMTAPNHLLTSAGRHQHPSALADLDGRRLVAISEPSGGRFDEALVKWLTGGEAIRARRMHCDSYEFPPTHKLFMSSNYKPEVREMGAALWRRLRLIPFPVTIPPEEEDRGLPGKLRDEASGILNWMVRGCLEWHENKLAEPEKVRQATRDYRDDMDPIGEFIAACCDQGPGLSAGSTELWNAYMRWCDGGSVPHGDRIPNIKSFGALLGRRDSRASGSARGRFGLGSRSKRRQGPTSPTRPGSIGPNSGLGRRRRTHSGIRSDDGRESDRARATVHGHECRVYPFLAAQPLSRKQVKLFCVGCV